MESTGITPVMDINHGNAYGDGFGFGGSGLWLFAILALMWGGFGNNNNLGYRAATAEDVNNGFNFNDLQSQNRDIINAITSGTAQSVAATNQTFHDTLAVFNDKYTELQRDVAGLAVGQANLLAKQNECCCDIKTAILNSDINTTAQVQKVLDTISANKIEALQSKINALELAQATSNVVRYPNQMTYAYAGNPFCSCGCGFNGNI